MVFERYVQLKDGRSVRIRAITLEDAPAISALCERLSETSSRQRFMTAGRRLSEKEARGVAQVDHVRNETLIALDENRLVALGSLQQVGEDPCAELTLLVEDAYQGLHLGRQMLAELVFRASSLGFSRLLAELHPDNHRMLHVLENAGLELVVDPYFGLTRVLVSVPRV